MKACDEKLRSSLVEAMKLDDARLEEEMQGLEPHVFSESFEKRMEKLMQEQRRKGRRRRLIRFAAAAAAILFLVGGPIFISSEHLNASALSIDIKEWLDRFFTVEDGAEGRKDDGVLFDESQLGYIPEGFEKVLEEETFSRVRYKYENDIGEYFLVRVVRVQSTMFVDNEEVQTKVQLNDAGLEYTFIARDESNIETIMWKTDEDIYYYVQGIIGSEELVKIMNNVKY